MERLRLSRGMKVMLGLALLAGCAGPAIAQVRGPAIACRISDSNISLDLYLPLSKDGTGNAARGMKGSLDIHHQKVPRDRRQWPLDDKLPAQFWNIGPEMKVRLLLGPADQFVDLVIETRLAQGANIHTGQFRLETSEGVRVIGRLECQVG